MNFLTAVGAFFYGLFATVFSLLASPLRRAAVGRGNSNRRSATAIFALVVIVGSMALLLMSRCRSTPKDETAAFTALGQMVAQETSKLLASRGQIVLVVPNT